MSKSKSIEDGQKEESWGFQDFHIWHKHQIFKWQE